MPSSEKKINIKTRNSFFFLFGSLQRFLDLDNKVEKIIGVWISKIYLAIRDSMYMEYRKRTLANIHKEIDLQL